MKYIFKVLLVIGLPMLVQARTWTNTDGQTLDAELERVKDDTVFLKMTKSRKIHPVRIETLSESDQAYITEYQAELAERIRLQRLRERSSAWHSDYKKAKAESEEFNLPILLLYTAPKWCRYCVILEDEVLSHEKFKEYAKENLVLLEADFSKKSDAADWRDAHPELTEKFPASGFPIAYLISTSGEKLGRIIGGKTPEGYIEKLNGFMDPAAKLEPGAKKKKRKKKK